MYLMEQGLMDTLSWAHYLPQPKAEATKAAARWEVWGTRFSDPDPDCCELRLYDHQGRLLETVRVAGY